jgi:hypothetical protein
MNSYQNSQVRIWSAGPASSAIDIKKGVKHGCPLSPLLFNICVDLLISYLRKASDFGYNTDELSGSISQSYADDMILVSDSEKIFKY